MGKNPSAPPFRIQQGRFSLGSPFLLQELPALLPWGLCRAAVFFPGALGAGCGDLPLGAFAVLNSVSPPTDPCWIPFPLLQWHHWLWHAGLMQNERGGTAVGWNGLVRGAQKTSTEQGPASSTRIIFPCVEVHWFWWYFLNVGRTLFSLIVSWKADHLVSV